MKSLLVSVLSLGRAQNVLALLTDLPRWLAQVAQDIAMPIHIVVRNNDPTISFEAVRTRLAECEAEQAVLRCTLVSGEPNTGFGRGHNANFRLDPADYVLILNDDIGFPHIDWLPEAVAILAQDQRTACIAAVENPQYLNPMFGNGQERAALAVETLKYAEASVLLFNGPVFAQLGMFDERLEWAMCEDADLSLRAQQLGYRLRWISIPHEHWRSTSVNSLPGAVRHSIQEHNRARLFAAWSETLATGRIGRVEVFDLHSDGMGDVFCVLPHLRAWLATLTPERRDRIVINTNHPELMAFLGCPGIRIMCEADRAALLSALDAEGVTAVHTIRDVNYALPLHMHPLLCGALGLPVCDDAGMRAFQAALRLAAPRAAQTALPASYCIVHLDFTRDHHGRALSAPAIRSVLLGCARLFETLVLVGKERRGLALPATIDQARVIDLRGGLSLKELIGVVVNASQFVGIDSLPAHVAQAAGVPAAVFFGAVHPVARVWDMARAWPLTAELDCIGCYHTHIEVSAPFCMRHDEACSSGPAADRLGAVLAAMQRNEPHTWSREQQRFHALQAQWFGLMRHHPAPPERLVRPGVQPNELVGSLVHRILDQAAELAATRYRSAAITALTERLREAETELFSRQIELDELRRHSPAPADAAAPPDPARSPIRILQLVALTLRADHCGARTAGQWLEIAATGEDPQVHLPPIRGHGGRVHLRLTCVAEHPDSLQVFWSSDSRSFTEDRQRTQEIGPEARSLDVAFDLAQDEVLWLRIDPTIGHGRIRLRGSVSGRFALECAEGEAAAPAESGQRATVPIRRRRQRERDHAE